MHPGNWFPKPKDGSKGDSARKLYPFYKSRIGPNNGEFYDSDDSRYTEPFGYVYDDLSGATTMNPQELWKNIQAKYTWQFRNPRHPTIGTPPPNMQPLNFSKTRFDKNAQDRSTGSTARMMMSTAANVAETVTTQAQFVLNTATKESVEINPKFDREWYVDSVVKRYVTILPGNAARMVTTIKRYIYSPMTDTNEAQGCGKWCLRHLFLPCTSRSTAK